MITIGVLTISDSGAKGAREDVSGENIRAMLTQMPGTVISAGAIIPDERDQVEAVPERRLLEAVDVGGRLVRHLPVQDRPHRSPAPPRAR